MGNGSSLLDKENGSKINQFSEIIRFNSFQIKGYEKYVGDKTNVWATVNSFHINTVNNFDRVVFHSWADDNRCKVFKKLKKSCNIPIKKVSKSQIAKIPTPYPSTGLIMIFMSLNEVNQVCITGFDWWDRKNHHYCDNAERGNIHNPHTEKEIIYDLVNQGKVVTL